MKKLILSICCLIATTTGLWAQDYDFYIINPTSGKKLFCEINSNGTSVSVFGEQESGNIAIPSSVTNNGKTYTVTRIRYSAFENCTGLTDVTIPNSVTEIGSWAFSGCTNLTFINIPSNVTSIEDRAFENCSKLTSFTIPNAVTNLGEKAFKNTGWWNNQSDGTIYKDNWCLGYKGDKPTGYQNLLNGTKGIANGAFSGTEIVGVTIPYSVIYIGENAFSYCSLLASVNTNAFSITPCSLTTIGDFAFGNCPSLSSCDIPASVTSIGSNILLYTQWWDGQPDGIVYKDGWCLGVKGNEVNGDITIQNGTKGFADWAFEGMFYTSPTTISIPNTVTKIAKGTFFRCEGITAVSIPNSVTEIGEYAFAECSGLTSVTIPNSVTKIGENAFDGCSGLTSIIIPAAVTNIDDEAFIYCSGLTSITCNAVTPPTITPGTFYYYDEDWAEGNFSAYNVPLYVPEGSVQAYKNHPIWGNFTNISAIESEGPDAIAETTFDNAQIFGGEKRIIIDNAANTNIAIYDIMGRTVVKAQYLTSNNEIFAVPQRGAYIVRMGKTTKKVWVK